MGLAYNSMPNLNSVYFLRPLMKNTIMVSAICKHHYIQTSHLQLLGADALLLHGH